MFQGASSAGKATRVCPGETGVNIRCPLKVLYETVQPEGPPLFYPGETGVRIRFLATGPDETRIKNGSRRFVSRKAIAKRPNRPSSNFGRGSKKQNSE